MLRGTMAVFAGTMGTATTRGPRLGAVGLWPKQAVLLVPVDAVEPLKCVDAERRATEGKEMPPAFPLAIANITLDSRSPLPIHEQICQAIRTAVWSEELPPGTVLPTSRELARHLGVARNTVVAAYARLVAEGLCVSNTRRGTRVALDLPLRRMDVATASAPSGNASLRTAFLARNALESRIDRMPGGTPFVLNISDPVLYPRTKLGRRLADKFLGAPSSLSAQSRPWSGSGRFQTGFAAFLRQARGVVCRPSQIIPVSGLEGALDLAARVLLDPGDTVHVEEPAMDIVHGAFHAARAQLEPLADDESGRADRPPARLMLVSPSVSFPFGLQMPERRRMEILAAARRQNAIVFENDAYCELRYSGTRLRTIQGLDTEGRVIYYGGLSEILGNSVDVGFLVVPPPLLEAFVEVSRRTSNTPPQQVQDALGEFVEDHEFALHARNVRIVYAKRMALAKEAFRSCLPSLPLSEPLGGLFLVLSLERGADDVAICRRAAGEGLPVAPLSRYALRTDKKPGIVFSVGAVTEKAIKPAVTQLAAVLGDCARTL